MPLRRLLDPSAAPCAKDDASSMESPLSRSASPASHPSRPRTASSPPQLSGRKRKRPTPHNVFASVAGRVTPKDRIHDPLEIPRPDPPLSPADALFAASLAPDRFEEPQLDPYGAHRRLDSRVTVRADVYSDAALQHPLISSGQGLRDAAQWNEVAAATGGALKSVERRAARRRRADGLPGDDLCKALHRYVSAFYTAHGWQGRGESVEREAGSLSHGDSAGQGEPEGEPKGRQGRNPNVSFRSMDETALLAMAILLEESARAEVGSATGGDGWRALVTGQGYEPAASRPSTSKRKRGRGHSRSDNSRYKEHLKDKRALSDSQEES